MKKSKWRNLCSQYYKLKDLGRPAIFLLPTSKLKKKIDGKSIENDLHEFLVSRFGAYTTSTIPSFGFWKDNKKATISDECREYEVSFLGKDRIPSLIKKLAKIASVIGEECIYLKTGQYSCLVYPKKKNKKSKSS